MKKILLATIALLSMIFAGCSYKQEVNRIEGVAKYHYHRSAYYTKAGNTRILHPAENWYAIYDEVTFDVYKNKNMEEYVGQRKELVRAYKINKKEYNESALPTVKEYRKLNPEVDF